MKKFMYYMMVGACLFFLGVNGQAQTISGKVVNSDTKKGLAAVNISFEIGGVESKINKDNGGKISVTEAQQGVKNQMTGTVAVTDQNGEYLVNVPDGAKGIIFSLPGFATERIDMTGQREQNVEMKPSASLDEVVVNVGYGTIKKRDMVGAASTISSSEVKDIPVPTIDQALQGRIAGVDVSLGDGQPGATPDIVIRGGNSITGSNSPLWVIDGFPTEDPTGLLDPSNIESVDILKDASSTAIYGARGANGVIVVTTKKSKEGRPTVTYDGYVGFQKVTRMLPVLEAYDYMILQRDGGYPYLDRIFNKYNIPQGDYEGFKNVASDDWQNQAFRTALLQKHSVRMGGGTGGTKYQLGVSYFNQQGILLNTGYDQIQTNLNIDQKVGKYVSLGVKATHTYQNSYGIAPTQGLDGNSYTNSVIYSLLSYPALSITLDGVDDPLVDPGINSQNDYRVNPIRNLTNAYRTTPTNMINANAYININPLPNLTIRSTVNIYYRNADANRFNNSLVAPIIFQRTQGINGAYTNTQILNVTNENTINYRWLYKIHELNVLVGASFMRGETSQKGFSSNNIPEQYEPLGMNSLNFGSLAAGIATNTYWLQNSYFGRVNYTLMKRYLISATMRADGSSRFAKNNQWGYFPSVGLGWKIDQENFWKSLLNYVNVFKLRASWGITGNNRVSDFPYQQLISSNYGPGLIRYPFGSLTEGLGTYVSTLANPNLKWETTEQYNVGVDLEFFKGRIAATVDYYFKNTYDLLLNAQIPMSTGFTTVYKNIGSVQNQGWEISLNTQNIILPMFTWNTNFNISFNRNKVTGLSDNQQYFPVQVPWNNNMSNVTAYAAIIGQPLGLMYGYVYDGIYRNSDFQNGVLKPDVPAFNGERNQTTGLSQAGNAKYKDMDGNKVINANDMVTIGNALPLHTGGFTNNFTFNFNSGGIIDLSIFFQWSYGNDILNANRMIMERLNSYSNNQFTSVVNRWTPQTDETASIYRLVTSGTSDNNAYLYSTRVVEDGSYLRLKNITLGYSIAKSVLAKIKLKQIRIYCSVNNIYTWTKYTGYDPEVSVTFGGVPKALMPGFDYSSYPRALSVTFGVNLTF